MEQISSILTDSRSKLLKASSHESASKLLDELEVQFAQRVLPFCNRCLDLTFSSDSSHMQTLTKLGVKKDIELHLSKINVMTEPEPEVQPEVQPEMNSEEAPKVVEENAEKVEIPDSAAPPSVQTEE